MTIHIHQTMISNPRSILELEASSGREFKAATGTLEPIPVTRVPKRSALSEIAYNIGLDYSKMLRGDEL